MGATKRLAELVIQAFSIENHSTQFITTRFGNVLGSNGSVVPLFKKQIQMGGPVTVTHPDMVRYFMTIGEACQLVLEASVIAEGGEIYIFDMGEPVKILDLAKNMIRLAGFRPDIDIKIEFIGERPGEKLFEELFSDEEKESNTRNEKILISKKSKIVNFDVEACIKKINSLEDSFDSNLYKSVIKEFIPEYSFINKELITTNDFLRV
jgi:FlaA1/EpsC-like NDP-sugar epimerase